MYDYCVAFRGKNDIVVVFSEIPGQAGDDSRRSSRDDCEGSTI